MKSIPLILVSISLAIMGQIFLKMGMNHIGKVDFSQFTSSLSKMATSPVIIVGLSFYAISAVLWMVVLSQVNLSYAYPFLGLTYVAILFLTKYIFNEYIPPWRWVGTAVIFLGVLISAKQ
ncbi:MAG TPA: hypothetical protein ENH19_02750 [Actinobacteria bacterium]|nr:hypothetical protein [Actinomycetes bacterium]HEX21554.1 hypothetical protein [Actinomycetota bacterium]